MHNVSSERFQGLCSRQIRRVWAIIVISGPQQAFIRNLPPYTLLLAFFLSLANMNVVILVTRSPTTCVRIPIHIFAYMPPVSAVTPMVGAAGPGGGEISRLPSRSMTKVILLSFVLSAIHGGRKRAFGPLILIIPIAGALPKPVSCLGLELIFAPSRKLKYRTHRLTTLCIRKPEL